MAPTHTRFPPSAVVLAVRSRFHELPLGSAAVGPLTGSVLDALSRNDGDG